MIRPTKLLLPAVVLLLAFGQDGRAAAAELAPAGARAHMIDEETGGTPLESIGEEAAIAGDGDADGRDEDPMARTEAEMIESADEDGCTGSVGEGCPGGDN